MRGSGGAWLFRGLSLSRLPLHSWPWHGRGPRLCLRNSGPSSHQSRIRGWFLRSVPQKRLSRLFGRNDSPRYIRNRHPDVCSMSGNRNASPSSYYAVGRGGDDHKSGHCALRYHWVLVARSADRSQLGQDRPAMHQPYRYAHARPDARHRQRPIVPRSDQNDRPRRFPPRAKPATSCWMSGAGSLFQGRPKPQQYRRLHPK